MGHRRLLRRAFGLILAVVILVRCSGSAEPTATPAPPTAKPIPTHNPVPAGPASIRELSPYWPTEGWQTSTPEEQGMDSEKLAEMLAVIQTEGYDIDSVTIIRNGYMVLDVTVFPFQPDSKHLVHSVTKSILSALVGIAIDEDYIENLQEPVLDFFDERTVANLTADKEAMTIEDLLAMATGLDCQDSNQIEYGWRGHDQLRRQVPDWLQYVLDLPMVETPGTYFEYCNGASLLLSAIIQETTGVSALEFAQKHLFAPLGIRDVVWPSSPQGITIGSGELRMRPHDMAKIGYLYLNEGMWNDEQVVSAAWIEQSTREQISTGSPQGGYGYHWWTDDSGIYKALGFMGQYIVVVPEKDMVVVFTSDLSGSDWLFPNGLVYSHVIPAAEAPAPLPANPDGVAKLQTLIQEVEKLPKVTPQPVPEPPVIAKQVLGGTFLMEENRLSLQSFSLAMQDQNEAVLRLTWDENLPYNEAEYRIGLDGIQRLATGPYDVLVAGMGRWSGENTFVAQVDESGNMSNWRLVLEFKDDKVTATLTGNFSGMYRIHGKRAGSP